MWFRRRSKSGIAKSKKERKLMAIKHLKGITNRALSDISIQKIKAEYEL